MCRDQKSLMTTGLVASGTEAFLDFSINRFLSVSYWFSASGVKMMSWTFNKYFVSIWATNLLYLLASTVIPASAKLASTCLNQSGISIPKLWDLSGNFADISRIHRWLLLLLLLVVGSWYYVEFSEFLQDRKKFLEFFSRGKFSLFVLRFSAENPASYLRSSVAGHHL